MLGKFCTPKLSCMAQPLLEIKKAINLQESVLWKTYQKETDFIKLSLIKQITSRERDAICNLKTKQNKQKKKQYWATDWRGFETSLRGVNQEGLAWSFWWDYHLIEIRWHVCLTAFIPQGFLRNDFNCILSNPWVDLIFNIDFTNGKNNERKSWPCIRSVFINGDSDTKTEC